MGQATKSQKQTCCATIPKKKKKMGYTFIKTQKEEDATTVLNEYNDFLYVVNEK